MLGDPTDPQDPSGLASFEPHALPPSLTIPAVPHPNALKEISIAVSPSGVWLKSAAQSASLSYVYIPFGLSPTVTEVRAVSVQPQPSWSPSNTLYGVVGILNLFRSSYLLVISSRNEVGDLFGRTIFAVKGVKAIPLEYDRAVAALGALGKRPPVRNPSHLDVTAGDSSSFVSDIDYTSSAGDDEESTGVDMLSELSSDGPPLPTVIVEKVVDESSPGPSNTSVYPTSVVGPAALRRFAQRLVFWNRKASTRSPEVRNEVLLTSNSSRSSNTGVTVPSPPSREPLPLPAESSAQSSLLKPVSSREMQHSELEPKILQETIQMFSREMYMAYDFDITTPLQRKAARVLGRDRSDHLLQDLMESDPDDHTHQFGFKAGSWRPNAEPLAHFPLWRRVDRRFWWNEDLMQGFMDAGLHYYVLPLMQGFIQMASLPIQSAIRPSTVNEVNATSVEDKDEVDVNYVIISRRSRQRAGLRYQRRGIDEDANVANFVETETIMCSQFCGHLNVFSHIQIRGSIPLFWSQSGLNLKRAPNLDRTPSESLIALRKHFDHTISTYGPHTIINLAETTGKEASVTNAYQEQVAEMGRNDVKYQGFDFHHECKGMRYENISKLITMLEPVFEHQGYFWGCDSDILSQQKGVFRMNCIDCLDRTNVVESAVARNVLLRQLQAAALVPHPEERKALEVVFNDVWANNGDAISRAYAGTSALKGDYTRTGKRDITGVLNDGMNALARMYTGAFTDYFKQAVIDYALGHRGLSVFTEFMLTMNATDPRELFRLSKIRAIAIETCSRLVVVESEEDDVCAGWTLLSPPKFNIRVADVFEEKIVLLTSKALYVVSYDYVLEKVRIATRVPLGNIVSVQKGAYILSPLQDAGRDVSQNYGFIVSYRPLNQVITRVTSYSVNNMAPVPDEVGEMGDPLTVSRPSPVNMTSAATIWPVPSSPRPTTLSHAQRSSLSGMSAASGGKNSTGPRRPPHRSLSKLLTSTAPTTTGGDEVVYVAFKALPVDHAVQEREEDGSRFTQPRHTEFRQIERPVGKTCKEVVDDMCAQIVEACDNAGLEGSSLLIEKDVVNLEEAQRSTPVFGKAEYALKRLLWLGG